MSDDLIPIPLTGHSSYLNDSEENALFDTDTCIDYHISFAKSATSFDECRIIYNTTFPPDDNTLIIMIIRKKGLVQK